MNWKKAAVIINPHAGGGSAGRDWPKLARLLNSHLGEFAAFVTEGPGDATRMTREALAQDVDYVICVGGDGTLNEVINGFIVNDAPIDPRAVLGFIPNGTGCDFIRSTGIPSRLGASVENIVNGGVEYMDIGRMTYENAAGETVSRYFHNIVSFGLGGEVDARVNSSGKPFGPFVAFIWATVVSVLRYGKKKVFLEVDESFQEEVLIWNVAVANGRYHGGGMLVAPEAKLKDGLFHVVVIGDLDMGQVFWHLPKLYNGRINRISQVTTLKGRRIKASSAVTTLLDVDGEQPGRLPVTLEIVPRVLPLVTAKSFT